MKRLSDSRRPEPSGKPLLWVAAALVFAGFVALFFLWPTSRSHGGGAPTAPSARSVSTPLASPSFDTSYPIVEASPTAPPSTERADEQLSPIDLFATSGPDIIDTAHRIVGEGGTVPLTKLKQIYDYGKQHPGDARPQLVMAGDAMHRGWYDQALDHYVEAVREDSRARQDPHALSDLVKIAGREYTAVAGGDAIAKFYGRRAQPVLEAAIAEATTQGDDDRAARLTDLVSRLDGTGGGRPK
jgi:hypothetical protein